MLKKLRFNTLFLGAAVFAASVQGSELQKAFEAKHYTTDRSDKLYTHKVNGLSNEELDIFILGKSFFRIPWVEAPSATTARDGLGPLFSANTCTSCHPNNGVSSLYNDKGDINRGYVTRLSIPSDNSKDHQNQLHYNGFVQEPNYGSQISINGSKQVPFEAKANIVYEKITFNYPDGEKAELLQPTTLIKEKLVKLQYGPLHKDAIISNRMPQSLVGMGLLEMISDEAILANEDVDDKDDDGISGKENRVYSHKTKRYELGRYTWKASAPSLIEQVANAAHNDMSLTTPFLTHENCTQTQKECLDAPKGDALRADTPFDLPMHRLEAISFYLQNLKVPKSQITQKEGEKLFTSVGCTKCHRPSFTLQNGVKIYPYTDMLLHDMGEALSDGRTEFSATANEWRTPPLWAIGSRQTALKKPPRFLHDGRARTIEEAILWHGGEAQTIKENFVNLSKPQREKLIQFIKEL